MDCGHPGFVPAETPLGQSKQAPQAAAHSSMWQHAFSHQPPSPLLPIILFSPITCSEPHAYQSKENGICLCNDYLKGQSFSECMKANNPVMKKGNTLLSTSVSLHSFFLLDILILKWEHLWLFLFCAPQKSFFFSHKLWLYWGSW